MPGLFCRMCFHLGVELSFFFKSGHEMGGLLESLSRPGVGEQLGLVLI